MNVCTSSETTISQNTGCLCTASTNIAIVKPPLERSLANCSARSRARWFFNRAACSSTTWFLKAESRNTSDLLGSNRLELPGWKRSGLRIISVDRTSLLAESMAVARSFFRNVWNCFFNQIGFLFVNGAPWKRLNACLEILAVPKVTSFADWPQSFTLPRNSEVMFDSPYWTVRTRTRRRPALSSLMIADFRQEIQRCCWVTLNASLQQYVPFLSFAFEHVAFPSRTSSFMICLKYSIGGAESFEITWFGSCPLFCTNNLQLLTCVGCPPCFCKTDFFADVMPAANGNLLLQPLQTWQKTLNGFLEFATHVPNAFWVGSINKAGSLIHVSMRLSKTCSASNTVARDFADISKRCGHAIEHSKFEENKYRTMANNHAHMPNQKVKNKRIPNDDTHMHPDNATPKTQSTTNTRHRRSTTKCKRAKPNSGNQIQTCKTQTRNQERRWTRKRKPNKHNTKSGDGTQHKSQNKTNSKRRKVEIEHIWTNCQFNIIGQKGKQSKPQAMSGCASHAFCL